MTEPAAPRRALQATVEVVTYDPLRRKGFMRIADPEVPGARVHFVLGVLPEPFKGFRSSSCRGRSTTTGT